MKEHDIVERNGRAVLNTTINKEVFIDFKNNCKESGIPMNILIETFMKQYNNGNFYLKFGKTDKKMTIDIEEN